MFEFFNKGLFRSLINAHGNQKPMTLEKAKSNKIIDNNIQLTLNALFPTNGLLYIKGEPYAIADTQWKKGDWKCLKCDSREILLWEWRKKEA